jgi:hypothetical protein
MSALAAALPIGQGVELPLWRLYLLRALYLLVVVGLGVIIWPSLIHHDGPWELMEGAETSMLGAFSALSLLGLRYPLQMLPLLLWELLWKLIWLVVVALPLWRAGQMDDATAAMAAQILLVVIIPFVIPWGHVWANYVRKGAERWRRDK